MNINEQILAEKLNMMKLAKKSVLEMADVLMEQSADVVREIIVFNMVYHSVWVLASVILIFIVPFIVCKILKFIVKKVPSDLNDLGCFASSSLIIMALLSIIIGLFNLNSVKPLIQTIVSPKLFLIEYLVGILK